MNTDKRILRRKMAQLRASYSSENIKTLSEQITKNLLSTEAFRQAETILCYVSCKDEVMTIDLIKSALRLGKKVAVPKVTGKLHMEFMSISSINELQPGFMGILEPEMGEIFADENALLIIPGLAFDIKGHRLGYGGGYYDAWIANHPGNIKCALCFSDQIIDEVPYDVYDQSMDIIITEKEIINIKKE